MIGLHFQFRVTASSIDSQTNLLELVERWPKKFLWPCRRQVLTYDANFWHE